MTDVLIGTLRFGQVGVNVLVSPASYGPAIEGFFAHATDDSPSIATLRLLVDEPLPDVAEGAPFSVCGGVITGRHDRRARCLWVCLPSWLLRPESIRGIDQFFVPLFYELTRANGEPLRAALFHGSAVEAVPGVAALFLAPSEGGKSTVASLAGDRPVFHEECQIVTLDDDGPHLASGPWFGYRTRPGADPVPLGGIFLLEKALTDSVESGPAAEAHGRVLSQVVLARGLDPVEPRTALERMADFCEALCRAVPPRVLRFRRDPAFWSVVEPALLKSPRR